MLGISQNREKPEGFWNSIGGFFGSAYKGFKGCVEGFKETIYDPIANKIAEGFSEGAGWEEEKRKEEERKLGISRQTTGEDLEEELRNEWKRNNRQSSNASRAQWSPSSMLLTGAYRR